MFYRICKSVLILLAINFLLGSMCMADQNVPMPSDWIEKIRPNHPRLFINSENLPAIRSYALGQEREYYQQILHTVKTIPLEVDNKACESGFNDFYGRYAQSCAFVWLIEQDKDALAKAKNYLKAAVKYYNSCSSQRKPVNWFSAGRVCAITAFDWIFDELTDTEREAIGKGFIKHNTDCHKGERFTRQNRSHYTTGFYGTTNMAWYIGLTLYGEKIDDKQAESLLKKGYEDHINLLNHRKKSAGTNGGIACIAIGYGLGMYPWSEFNFMHTFQSATGHNVADSYNHMSLLGNWVVWNHLPDRQRFGLGDSTPGGSFPDYFLEMHMLNLSHFYAKRFPQRAGLATYIRQYLLTSQQHDDYWWPIAPFYATNSIRAGAKTRELYAPNKSWPHAKNFDTLGAIHMRSDWGHKATCAVYLSGGELTNHRHYDQGHFAIYSGEHLTGNSGHYGGRRRNEHLTEYFYRSVAANCLLIKADEEHDTPAKVWGGLAKTLDGGQYKHAGKQIAFETNDYFTYAATNTTGCYDSRKCRFAARQFVFIYPDTFVVFDRAVSTKKEFEKTWLLHSVEKAQAPQPNKIIINGEKKSLHTTILLPEQVNIDLIGGKDNEFFSAGKNRPQINEMPRLAGSWRAEVTPKSASTQDIFLNVIQVTDKNKTPTNVTLANNTNDKNSQGANLKVGNRNVNIIFNTKGKIGGKITISDEDGQILHQSKLQE